MRSVLSAGAGAVLRPPDCAVAPPCLARHNLVWLEAASSNMVRTAREEDRKMAEAWMRAGRPFVVRREEGASSAGDLPLGLPLPNRFNRRRIALGVPRERVRRIGRMPRLDDACEAAFSRWQGPLRRLAAQLIECGADVRAYGSLGWQYLTGEPYLHPGSDIDLLIEPSEEVDTDRLLAVLSEARAGDCPRLDGEIALEPDRMMAWRELFTGTPEVLVRGRDGIILLPREMVRQRLAKGVSAC